jgi:hypothetical protein
MLRSPCQLPRIRLRVEQPSPNIRFAKITKIVKLYERDYEFVLDLQLVFTLNELNEQIKK